MRATNRTTAADKPRNKPATHWAAAENFSRWAQMADEAIAELGMTWPLDREQAVEVARALEYDLRRSCCPFSPAGASAAIRTTSERSLRSCCSPSVAGCGPRHPRATMTRSQGEDSPRADARLVRF